MKTITMLEFLEGQEACPQCGADADRVQVNNANGSATASYICGTGIAFRRDLMGTWKVAAIDDGVTCLKTQVSILKGEEQQEAV